MQTLISWEEINLLIGDYAQTGRLWGFITNALLHILGTIGRSGWVKSLKCHIGFWSVLGCFGEVWSWRCQSRGYAEIVLFSCFFLLWRDFTNWFSPNADENLHVHVGQAKEGENPCCQGGVPQKWKCVPESESDSVYMTVKVRVCTRKWDGVLESES